MNKRPNILLIHSDQHRYDCVGAHGHRLVQTPHLDRLAAEGATFCHAFTPIAICTPARASLLTGAWPTTHGSLCIPGTEGYRSARPELPVLTRLLHDAGYSTSWVGKFHREVEGAPTDHGVENYVCYSGYKEWRAAQGLAPEPFVHGLYGEVDEACPPDKSGLHWQCDRVLELLERARESERPFFMRWDPPEPHLPARAPRELADLYPPETIAPWPSFPDSLEGKPYAQRFYRDVWGLQEWTWDDWAPIVSSYLGVITLLDRQIGRLLAWLEERGLMENTLVIYSTDHGDYCGGHGSIDKHFAMYDDLMRVPLLVRWPGHVQAGTRPESFVSNEIDIARTILEAAQIEAPPSFVGHDLVSLANGAPGRDDIFAQYFGTHCALYSMRMVRDQRWKYIYSPGGDELYDLETDPGELVNRIADPHCAAERARLKRRLWEWMQKASDPLANQWTRVHLLGGTLVPGPTRRLACVP